MRQRDNKKHLFLIAFVAHQFHQLNDVLIEILIQSVQTTLNSGVRENKEMFYEERQSRHQMIGILSQKLTKHLSILEQIETTVQDKTLSDKKKVQTVKQLLPHEQRQEYTSLQEEVERLGKESKKIAKNGDYYDILESKSIKLQNRVSDIVKTLKFDVDTSNQHLIVFIRQYL